MLAGVIFWVIFYCLDILIWHTLFQYFIFGFLHFFFVGKQNSKRVIWPIISIFPFILFTLALRVQLWDGFNSTSPLVESISNFFGKDNAVILLSVIGLLVVIIEFLFYGIFLYKKTISHTDVLAETLTDTLEDTLHAITEQNRMKTKAPRRKYYRPPAMKKSPYMPSTLPKKRPYTECNQQSPVQTPPSSQNNPMSQNIEQPITINMPPQTIVAPAPVIVPPMPVPVQASVPAPVPVQESVPPSSQNNPISQTIEPITINIPPQTIVAPAPVIVPPVPMPVPVSVQASAQASEQIPPSSQNNPMSQTIEPITINMPVQNPIPQTIELPVQVPAPVSVVPVPVQMPAPVQTPPSSSQNNPMSQNIEPITINIPAQNPIPAPVSVVPVPVPVPVQMPVPAPAPTPVPAPVQTPPSSSQNNPISQTIEPITINIPPQNPIPAPPIAPPIAMSSPIAPSAPAPAHTNSHADEFVLVFNKKKK